MALFRDFFSSSRAPKAGNSGREGQDSQDDGLSAKRGPETMPVKMNLEERMAFRRELLYEAIRNSLQSRYIVANTYRLKVMRTDKRGHCFVVMLDMSPTFMASPAGQHASLKEIAALIIKNAETKYGLLVGGIYWRSDDTLDASVANWAKPVVAARPGPSTESQRQSNIEKFEAVTAEEMAEFEAAWQKASAVQVGDRTYSSDMAPLMDESHR
ncbi:MAG: hypothetical protein WBK51_03565 [Polaromonas sp.]